MGKRREHSNVVITFNQPLAVKRSSVKRCRILERPSVFKIDRHCSVASHSQLIENSKNAQETAGIGRYSIGKIQIFLDSDVFLLFHLVFPVRDQWAKITEKYSSMDGSRIYDPQKTKYLWEKIFNYLISIADMEEEAKIEFPPVKLLRKKG